MMKLVMWGWQVLWFVLGSIALAVAALFLLTILIVAVDVWLFVLGWCDPNLQVCQIEMTMAFFVAMVIGIWIMLLAVNQQRRTEARSESAALKSGEQES